MSIPDCYVKVQAYMKSRGEAPSTQFMADMAKRLAEVRAESMSPADFSRRAEEIFSIKRLEEVNAERAAKMISLAARTRAASILTQDIPGAKPHQIIVSYLMGGMSRIGKGMNLSIEAMSATNSVRFLKGLHDRLGDLREIAEEGMLTREITQEMDALEKGLAAGASGSEKAVRIAKAYHQTLGLLMKSKQAFDPFLGKINDYLHRASHDPVKVKAMGKDAWVAFAESKYGKNSFPELRGEEKTKAFGRVYDEIVSGRHSYVSSGRVTGGDIMQRMAARRTLIPDNWEAFYEYNQALGLDNVHTAVLRAVESGSHDVAVIQKLGASPADTFEKLINDIKRRKPDSAQDIDENIKKIRSAFDVAVNRSSMTGTKTAARIIRGMMMTQQLSKNNASFLRSYSDFASGATALSNLLGEGYVGLFADLHTRYLAQLPKNPEAPREAARSLYLFTRSAHAFIFDELGNPGVVGRGEKIEAGISKMLEVQSKYTLADRHIRAMNAAMATLISDRFGKLTELEYGALPKQFQDALVRYDVGAPEWKVLKASVEDWSELGIGAGKRALTAESVENVSDDVIAGYLKETGLWKGEGEPSKGAIERGRTEIATRVGSIVFDHAHMATSTPQMAERFFLYGGTDGDSWQGLSIRLIAQFKSAMIKNINTINRGGFTYQGQLKGSKKNVARHLVLATGLYSAGELARQTMAGQTPEDPLQPSFLMKALVNSGAGGILGDVMLGEILRQGGDRVRAEDIADGIVGPVVSEVAALGVNAWKVGGSIVGANDFPSNAIGAQAARNVPYQNLFYAKFALNYYITDSIREWFEPGYMRGTNRRMADTPALGGGQQEYFMFDPNQ